MCHSVPGKSNTGRVSSFIKWKGAHNKKLRGESLSAYKNCGNLPTSLQVQENPEFLWGLYAIHHILTSIYMGRGLVTFKKKSKERSNIRFCHTVSQFCITVLFSNILSWRGESQVNISSYKKVLIYPNWLSFYLMKSMTFLDCQGDSNFKWWISSYIWFYFE